MPAPLRLFDLFPSLETTWRFDQVPAIETADIAWLATLNQAVNLIELRTVASGTGLAFECQFEVEGLVNSGGGPGLVIPRNGFLPFQLRPIRGIQFRLLNTVSVATRKRGRLFVNLPSSGGAEVLLEDMPVEILLPPDLVSKYYDTNSANNTLEQSSPNITDTTDALQKFDLQTEAQVIVLKDISLEGGFTSIFTHLRLHLSSNFEFTLSTPSPISFGRCNFMGFPCLAVHGFQLIPSLRAAHEPTRRLVEGDNWIRHSIDAPFADGAIGFRSMEIDFSSDFFKELFPNYEWKAGVESEWVFEDLVMAMGAGAFLPLPLQATVGLRRNLEELKDELDFFSFDTAPIDFFLFDRKIHVRVYQLFFRTMPGTVDTNVKLGFAFNDESLDESQHQNWEVRFETDENLTFRIGLAWQPDADTKFRRLRISDDVIIDLMSLMVGYSVGKAIDGKSVGDCLDIFGSLWIHDKNAKLEQDGAATSDSTTSGGTASGTETNVPVKVKAADNSPFSLVISNIGWRQGKLVFEKFSLPDGATASLGPIAIDLFEMGVVNENAATYFSVSGGLRIQEAKKFEGGVGFKRMRFRMAGNPAAPAWKLDGFSGFLKIPELLDIDLAGYYTDEINVPEDFRKKEFGFAGKLALHLASGEWVFALDLITGQIDRLSSDDDFGYFMMQLFISGKITICAVELNTIRLLLSINMSPKLSAGVTAEKEFRYYRWQKTNDPMRVPGDRRLQAWKVEQDAVSFGFGFGISFAGLGDVVRLQAFFMYLNAPTSGEKGFLIAIEMFLAKAKDPLAWALLEYDLTRDKFAILIGVDIKISKIVENAPDTFDDLLKIKGTIFIGNKPCTFALGRLDDQTTWMMVVFDFKLFGIFRSYMMLGLCIELVEGGPEGIAFVFRMEGGVDCGIISINYYAGLMIMYRTFKTGTADFVFLATADVGGSVSLLQFLRFGLGIHGEIRHLGNEPTYTTFALRLHIETPWWLPDVSWTFEHVSGSIHPEIRSMASPLTASASGLQQATQFSAPLHLERIPDGLFSLDDLAVFSLSENVRLQNFANALAGAGGKDPLPPLPTDAVLQIQFSNPVEQSLGIGSPDPAWGTQLSGDDANHLKIKYRLTSISVRRRPRYGSSLAWTNIEQHHEVLVLPNGLGGVVGSGTFGPTAFSYLWDADVQVAGQPAPIRLLINGSTPFSFSTQNLEADDDLIHDNPSYPCCPRDRWTLHTYSFRQEPEGLLDRSRWRQFSDSNGLEIVTADGIIRPDPLPENPKSPFNVACFSFSKKDFLENQDLPGQQVLRAVFDEDAVFVAVRVLQASLRSTSSVRLIGEDKTGEILQEKRLFSNDTEQRGWQTIVLSGFRFRTVRLIAEPNIKIEWSVCVDSATWMAWADYEQIWACSQPNPNRQLDYSGNGNLFFLPNHEYEIALAAEISVRHNSTEWVTRPCTDFVYFATKGLPGLNHVQRTGAELEPYIRSTYPNRRGWVYAKEPVVLVLDERYKITLPLDKRRPGSAGEHTQIVQLHLAVRQITGDVPNPAAGAPVPTDWLTASKNAAPMLLPWLSEMRNISARSIQPQLQRLEGLLGAAAGSCVPAQVTLTNHTLLLAQPFGIAANGQNCWVPGAVYRSAVGLDNQVFIHRDSFEDDDLAGFELLNLAANWQIFERKLRISAAPRLTLARFGEADWNHFTVKSEISGLDGSAGIAVGIDAVGSNGLYILLSGTPVGDVFLEIFDNLPHLAVSPIATKQIPSAAKFQLEITAFDDRVSAAAGGERLDVPRHGIREGFCALVGKGSADFVSLHLEALDMYAFGFRASRFKDFETHIDDFDLEIREIPLLPGVDFSTVLAARQLEIAAAMQTAASDDERETALVNLSAATGLLLTEQVEKSRISALRQAGGQIRALLLESPESLDVAGGEVQIEARLHRVETELKPLKNLVGTEKMIEQFEKFYKKNGLNDLVDLRDFNLPRGMDLPLDLPLIPVKKPGLGIPGEKWKYLPMLDKLKVSALEGNGLHLVGRRNADFDLSANEMVFFLSYHAGQRRLSIYECSAKGKNWTAQLVSNTRLDLEIDDLLSAKNSKGDFQLLLAPQRRLVFFGDLKTSRVFWDLILLQILQNGEATKLLLFPVFPSAPFDHGTWRLSFKINRERFSTNENNTMSTYKANKNITINIT